MTQTATAPRKPAATKATIEPEPTLPTHPDDIKMGFEMIEAVSKFRGKVIARNEQLAGNIQFGLQPEVKGEAMPDAHYFDWHCLGIVGPGISARLATPATSGLRLGEAVKDVLSGFSGLITERITFQNGCIFFVVQPKMPWWRRLWGDPGSYPESRMFERQRLRRTGPGLSEMADEPKPPPVVARQPDLPAPPPSQRKPGTGGPSRAMNSQRFG